MAAEKSPKKFFHRLSSAGKQRPHTAELAAPNLAYHVSVEQRTRTPSARCTKSTLHKTVDMPSQSYDIIIV